MLTAQEQKQMEQAGRRLARNPDLTLFLTLLKKEYIQDLTVPNQPMEELKEANRRYTIADALQHRIDNYGEK